MSYFEPGRQLYFVYRHNRNSEYVTIEKVGRRWLSLSNRCRVDKDTLIADGGEYTSPGRAYVSQEQYEAEAHANKLWNTLRRRIPWGRHSSISAADIEKAASLLRINLQE